jgi:hypothetical protein
MRLVSQSMYQYVEHSTRWAYEAKLLHFERPAGDEVRLFSSDSQLSVDHLMMKIMAVM